MATTNEQIAQLRAAIGALESQRPVLGDAIVETGLGPLRERLAALESRAGPEQQRKLATVLFMDIAGHTQLIRDLDPEENMALIDAALARLAEPIGQFGGHIARYQGDGFKAVFGLPTAHEDDPENAVRAALAIQSLAQQIDAEWKAEHEAAILRVRVGIDTGLVFAGGQTEGRDTIKGMPVNLASRLESAAAPGTILISHHTYRQIRGVFSVQPREPIAIKGIEEPVQTYVVIRAKPRAFRMATRGVEGIETRMVGRDYELGLLQDAYLDSFESAEPRVVTIIGEAGVGKSRLLYEFDNWLELRPELILYFKGRATPNTQNVPYGLFRDLFAARFEILDSDSAEVALEKFRAGMAGILEPEQSDLVGHWLGFDFSASEAVQRLLGDSGFVETARAYLTRYFRALVAANPVVVLLEDLHWADDQSLDLVGYPAELLSMARLLGQTRGLPLFVVCAARPTLLERRPRWGEGQALFSSVYLKTLSRRSGVDLVKQILKRVEKVPDELCDLIVESAEGNPFYVEELVKMLIDQGVIERGIGNYELGIGGEERENGGAGKPGSERDAPLTERSSASADHWAVHMAKLKGVKVPPTLIGLLQARLDSLPRPEREALQRASVIGRFFWDEAVADLLQTGREAASRTLEAIRGRELIHRREQSSFVQAEEYVFRHALLRDVTYETVLLRRRAEFHRRVARWLEKQVGDRPGEYLNLIAEHYSQGGEGARAAVLLEQSGDEALQTGAFAVARRALERAMALRKATGKTDVQTDAATLLKIGRASFKLGDLTAAEAALERALAGARQVSDCATEAKALAWLALSAKVRGDYGRARALAEAALPLGQTLGGQLLARTQLTAADVLWDMGELDAAQAHANEVLAVSRAIGDLTYELGALSALANIETDRRDLARAMEIYHSCLELSRRTNHLSYEGLTLLNLGDVAYLRGDFAAAKEYGRLALERLQELGEKGNLVLLLGNLAQADLKLGDATAARHGAREALVMARSLGLRPYFPIAVYLFGQILAETGEIDRALALYGLARAHPALVNQVAIEMDEEIARLGRPAAEVEAGLAAGAALDFETVVQEILDGKW